MTDFPRPIEGGNDGDGMPLLLGDPDQIGDLYAGGGGVAVLDWDGDGTNEVVVVGQELFTYRLTDTLADGTPVVDRGLRWGEVSRTPQRDENDAGVCGSLLTAGDFDGDGTPEVILAPRGYSRVPTVVLQLKDGPPKHRSQGLPFTVVDRGELRATSSEGIPQRAPPAPAWLPKEAKVIWKRLVRRMIDMGSWQPIFAAHLAIYCQLLGELQSDPSDFKATRLTQMRLFAGDLGLSPTTIDRVARLGKRR